MSFLLVLGLVVGVSTTVSTVSSATPAGAQAQPTPIVFVHGALGSGAQYRSQAMRFASNGFPANRIRAFDYNFDAAGLDAFIDGVRQEFGVQQVNVAAHSLGTAVMFSYLLNSTTAAKVDKYVALDGIGAFCLFGTECTSISASSLGQTHIEASLSPESFDRQYRHFMGAAPQTTRITPTPGQVELGGRVLDFQVNTPATGTQVAVWPIDAATGARQGTAPVHSFTVSSTGNFGPLRVTQGQAYEFELNRPGAGVIHVYYQPFIRSTYLLRLQALPANSPVLANTNFGPNHAAGVVLRYREWWRSHGARNDNLDISTTSGAGNQPARNVLVNEPSDVAGIHVFDDTATPRQSSLALDGYFSGQAFQTGVDVYMPGASPTNGSITFSNNPRGNAAQRQVITIPNWASLVGGTRHGFLVEFNDYVQ
jgi:pimeloyl-ACP methyl ester carboxylesterase